MGSCSNRHLAVYSEYLDHSYLASSQADTPDPRRCDPFCGQQLIIRWHFPLSYSCYSDLKIVLQLQMRDRSRRREVISVDSLRGYSIYRVINVDFWRSRGILSYRLDVVGGGQVVESWTHQIWAELIDIEAEYIPSQPDDLVTGEQCSEN